MATAGQQYCGQYQVQPSMISMAQAQSRSRRRRCRVNVDSFGGIVDGLGVGLGVDYGNERRG